MRRFWTWKPRWKACAADSGEGVAASVSEEEFSLELNLDDAEEVDSRSDEGADVPILDLEIAPEDGPSESALDSEGGFTLELDLDDISEEPDLLGEDADVSNAASETEDTGVLAAVNGDSDSEDEFLFNMDLEKFEDAPDELESTAPVAGHFDRTGELDSELTSDSPELMSKSADMPESFEVVEEILLSSDHDKNAQDNVQQDEEFIDAFDMGIPTDEFEELNENRRDEEKPEKITIGDEGASTDIAPVGRRRLGLPVLILLLALLGALLFWAYSFGLFEGFNAKNIIHKIPIVKEYFPVPPKHAGEIVTLENTIKNRFVENKVVGTLFVITGKVRNDFPTHRSHIQVVGKLFSPGKKPAGVESVYCGNSLTDEELVSLPPDQIKARLGDKSGKNTSNVNVPPGKILPYMIVFHNLPETLEEFTVAVKGSQPSSG